MQNKVLYFVTIGYQGVMSGEEDVRQWLPIFSIPKRGGIE